jgi:undecaprenyl pyrophosphate phosphatase UppP
MTIVNQYPIMELMTPVWVILLLCIVTCVFAFLATKTLIEEDWRIASVLFGVTLVFGIALCLAANIKQEGKRNRYECLINNTISFVEVAENYDIVEQRGDLWILEDKIDE